MYRENGYFFLLPMGRICLMHRIYGRSIAILWLAWSQRGQTECVYTKSVWFLFLHVRHRIDGVNTHTWLYFLWIGWRASWEVGSYCSLPGFVVLPRRGPFVRIISTDHGSVNIVCEAARLRGWCPKVWEDGLYRIWPHFHSLQGAQQNDKDENTYPFLLKFITGTSCLRNIILSNVSECNRQILLGHKIKVSNIIIA